MTATVTQIAAALGAAVNSGVQTPSGNPIRYLPRLADTFTPPICLVAVEKTNPHLSFGGGKGPYEFSLHLILNRSSDRASIQAMEGYMSDTGPSSVSLAVESDVSLGGVIQSCIVKEVGPPGAVTIAPSNAVYISIPFQVTVYP